MKIEEGFRPVSKKEQALQMAEEQEIGMLVQQLFHKYHCKKDKP